MKQYIKTSIILCACAMITVLAGCHSKPVNIKGFEDDSFDPSSLTAGGGTYALPAGRFEDGERVTDVSFENVQFNYDSFQIANSEIPKIEAVAAYMKSHPAINLVLEGNCDERGSREYNISLGENRALAVRAQLIGLGIDGNRIQTRSYGEENPLDPGHNEAAWRINRRVEFALYR